MRFTLLLLFLLGGGTLAQSCHPECRWACDDPVCPAQCSAQCNPAACQIVNASNLVCGAVVPDCRILCSPTPQCESSECPACEVQCDPPPTLCGDGTILCEAPVCGWQCVKPTCPLPQCELQCEAPTCEAPSSSGTRVAGVSFTLLLLVGLLCV
jgi:hypothetical protein